MNKGSEWRKWDLHVHTPETKKNDQFHGSTPAEKWDNYVKAINDSIEQISVIGITDYFCIENYFKFNGLIQQGKITKQFDLVLPNIEIRVLPVTGSSTPINLHCIFNPSIDREIETRFLSKLRFDYSGSNYSAKKEELVRLGKALPGNTSLNDPEALKAGVGQYVITVESLKEIFEKDPKLRSNTIIVVSNSSNDGVTGIMKHSDFFIQEGTSQLDATRWSIYQFSDAIFSSRDKDVLYFTGRGPDKKELVMERCKTLMPCFHGSDAHDNTKIFKPDQNRFCWIKADPTFEGLKQTLYEPEQRVKIQNDKPDFKEDRLIISEVQFKSSNKKFTDQIIYLNENLNVIIGGKSSGKSILLYNIARTLLADRGFLEREGIDNKYRFEKEDAGFDFKIKTKGGFDQSILRGAEENSVIPDVKYIPQNYLVKLAEPEQNKTGATLNKIVRDLINEDDDSRRNYDAFIDAVKANDKKRESIIDTYFEIKNRITDLEAQFKLKPKVEILESNISTNTTKVEELNKSAGMTAEEIEKYNQLQKQLEGIQSEWNSAGDDFKKVEKFNVEALDSLTNLKTKHTLFLSSLQNETLKGLYTDATPQIESLLSTFNTIATKIETTSTEKGRKIKNDSEVSKLFADISSRKKKVEEELKPYLQNEAIKKQIEELTKSINDDKASLQTIAQLTKEIANSRKALSDEKEKLFSLYENNIQEYTVVIEHLKIRTTDLTKEDGLKITGQIKFNFPKFRKHFLPTNDGRKRSFEDFSICDEEHSSLTEYQLANIISELKSIFEGIVEMGSYMLKGNDKKAAIKLLLDDYFFDYWLIEYKNDKLGEMSTGKASFVILMLIVGLSKSKAPILIDQPEDNLDNRSISSDLVTYLRNKKTERQIILVTHNPNVVVNADAENIIVANQKNQNGGASSSPYSFDYISGSLENSFSKIETEMDLLKSMGIREHIADIVEGGKEAFQKREEKYGFKYSII